MTDLLNGRYDLGDVVGSGGMGAVRRAVDTRLGRTVAVKILRGGALADDVARSRMRSEAKLASSIHHPGVAQVFDYDDASSTHGGMSFIVMEHIDGRSLAQLLREEGPMPVDQVLSIVQQVADALDAAHTAGVVHRDLKPANIMVTPAGRTVLVDFGIASSPTSEPLTETGALLGTADYFSPEQAAGRSATASSDLYALGIVAYQCLTGASPFRRDNPVATALAHLGDPLPPLDPGVPADVRDLVVALTQKDPTDRPARAADVARTAASIGAAPAIDVPPTQSLAATQFFTATPEPASVAISSIAAPRTRRPRPRRAVALYSGAGVAVAAVMIMGLGHAGSGPDPTVPDVVGMDAAEAASAISADGMTAQRTTVDSPGTPAGEVVTQDPAAGVERPDDGTVDVTVASGKVTVAADSLVGSSYETAAAALEGLGLVVARTDVPSSGDAGQVVALDRSGRLPDGSTVTLSVAIAEPTPASPTSAAPVASVGRSSSSTPPRSTTKANGKNTSKSTKKNGKGKGNGKGRGKNK